MDITQTTCERCGWHCTDAADCKINQDLRADGVDTSVYRNPLAEDWTTRHARTHEAAFAALTPAEQARRYARAEQDTAGAWLGTWTS